MLTATGQYALRQADPEDVPAITRLARPFLAASAFGRYLSVTAEKVAAAVAKRISDPGSAVFVVTRGTVVVGALIAQVGGHWLDEDARLGCELAWWVDPDHRGIGRELLDCFDEWAKAQGVEARVLSAARMRDGRPADLLIERAGYESVEEAFMKSGGD